MNKFVRFSLLLIFLVALGVLVLAFVEPNDVTVTRSIVIRANKEPVFAQIVQFKNWNNWYILQERDTAVRISYSGNDGQPGSAYHWAGNERLTGEGEIKNEGVDSTAMRYTFTVTKPGELLADGNIVVSDTAGLTKVTWTFHKHFAFLANAVLVVFNLDKYIGGDFDLALGNLKQYMEKNAVYKAPVAVKEATYPGHIFAGVRQRLPMADLTQFFGASYGMLYKTLGPKVNGNATGIYYTWDTVGKQADIMAAVPVADSATTLKDAAYVWVPASKSYLVVYKGPYSGIGAAYSVMDKYMQVNGKAAFLKIEEYPLGPVQEPDSTKWITNIYYLVP